LRFLSGVQGFDTLPHDVFEWVTVNEDKKPIFRGKMQEWMGVVSLMMLFRTLIALTGQVRTRNEIQRELWEERVVL
jgi:hypothetical protein